VSSHDQDLRELGKLLEAARTITHELRDEPLFGRLLDVFARMPPGDREVVVGALDREVRTRVLSQEHADDITQVTLRPNPNAQIYLRVVGRADKSPVEMLRFLSAAKNIQSGVDALDPQWRAMVLTALREIDPAARASFEQFNQIVTDLLAEAKRLGPIGASEPPITAQDEPAPADASKSRR
jgi:hypothetical protein